MYDKPYLIAEIGCNHKGDIGIAKQMIKTASQFCNVDCVKFQKRNPKELLTKEQYYSPHPNKINSYGDTYGEHREFLEFDVEQHRQLKKWCETYGVVYSCSVWDMTSAKEIVSLKPKFIKIPSASNTNFDMLEWICHNFHGEIHLSLGMTSHDEEEEIVKLFENNKRNKDLILYCCTSGYPVAANSVCLLEIKRLIKLYKDRVKDIGFSGHHIGIGLDVAAYTLGASIIERHFTLDRRWKGTDHAASLEAYDMRDLRKNLDEVYLALSYKKSEILDIEQPQRSKLKYKKK